MTQSKCDCEFCQMCICGDRVDEHLAGDGNCFRCSCQKVECKEKEKKMIDETTGKMVDEDFVSRKTASINGFVIQSLESFPPNENPFVHDFERMGTCLGKNCVLMYSTFASQDMKSLVIVNTETGERIKVIL